MNAKELACRIPAGLWGVGRGQQWQQPNSDLGDCHLLPKDWPPIKNCNGLWAHGGERMVIFLYKLFILARSRKKPFWLFQRRLWLQPRMTRNNEEILPPTLSVRPRKAMQEVNITEIKENKKTCGGSDLPADQKMYSSTPPAPPPSPFFPQGFAC